MNVKLSIYVLSILIGLLIGGCAIGYRATPNGGQFTLQSVHQPE